MDSASFICGTDSPVRVASLTTALPRSRTQSQGTTSTAAALLPSAAMPESCHLREIRSPGRRSVVVSCCHFEFRYTCRWKGLAAMPLSMPRVRSRWKAVVASSRTIVKRVNSVYCQYSSRSQRMAVKSWNMAMGDSSCDRRSSRKRGWAMDRRLMPNVSLRASASSAVATPWLLRYSRIGRSTGYLTPTMAPRSFDPAPVSSSGPRASASATEMNSYTPLWNSKHSRPVRADRVISHMAGWPRFGRGSTRTWWPAWRELAFL
mmetsp:Transcript_67444/g.119583  ORF Transcript_67444/g.119583 Transcript_67444/m.119583 type:complete len:262 (-) Transcript_67444:655-1440(-)